MLDLVDGIFYFRRKMWFFAGESPDVTSGDFSDVTSGAFSDVTSVSSSDVTSGVHPDVTSGVDSGVTSESALYRRVGTCNRVDSIPSYSTHSILNEIIYQLYYYGY